MEESKKGGKEKGQRRGIDELKVKAQEETEQLKQKQRSDCKGRGAKEIERAKEMWKQLVEAEGNRAEKR